MSTSVKLEKPERPERSEKSEKKSNICQEKMLASLWKMKSEPLDYIRIDVKQLFDNRYRVNVWGGDRQFNGAKITNSYFVLVKANSEVSSIRPD
jgi:hypothetical protein